MNGKIFIRVATKNINTAINYEYKSDNEFKISLCPIPDFIGEANCSCGKPASILVNELEYKCNDCLSNMIPENKLISKKDISTPITLQTVRKMKYEFSFDEEKWYSLWGNIIETSNWEYFINCVKKMILEKRYIEFDGEYTQGPPKKMILY